MSQQHATNHSTTYNVLKMKEYHCNRFPLINEYQSDRFPSRLHVMLRDPELADIISWLPHGKSFLVLKQKDFEQVLLQNNKGYKQYFKNPLLYQSFKRCLNKWGFHHIKEGYDKGSWFNKFFHRDHPELVQKLEYHNWKNLNNNNRKRKKDVVKTKDNTTKNNKKNDETDSPELDLPANENNACRDSDRSKESQSSSSSSSKLSTELRLSSGIPIPTTVLRNGDSSTSPSLSSHHHVSPSVNHDDRIPEVVTSLPTSMVSIQSSDQQRGTHQVQGQQDINLCQTIGDHIHHDSRLLIEQDPLSTQMRRTPMTQQELLDVFPRNNIEPSSERRSDSLPYSILNTQRSEELSFNDHTSSSSSHTETQTETQTEQTNNDNLFQVLYTHQELYMRQIKKCEEEELLLLHHLEEVRNQKQMLEDEALRKSNDILNLMIKKT